MEQKKFRSEPKVATSIRLKPENYEWLCEEAERLNVTRAMLLESIVEAAKVAQGRV